MVPFGELFEGKWWHPTWHKPLLGKYSLSDPIVISKHVDFATGHGVNCFFIDTQWNNFKKISEVVTNSLFFEKGVVFALLYNSITSPSLKKIDGWKIDFNPLQTKTHKRIERQNAGIKFYTTDLLKLIKGLKAYAFCLKVYILVNLLVVICLKKLKK